MPANDNQFLLKTNRSAPEKGEIGDYKRIEQINRYETISGRVVLPLAYPDGEKNFAIVRLHQPYGYRYADWDLARHSRPPILPAATDTPNDTLLDSVLDIHLPVADDTQGVYHWRVKGLYTFVQNVVRTPGHDVFPTGAYPFARGPQETAAEYFFGAKTLSQVDKLDFKYRAMTLGSSIEDDITTGTFQWPFLFLPPTFFTTHYFVESEQ